MFLTKKNNTTYVTYFSLYSFPSLRNNARHGNHIVINFICKKNVCVINFRICFSDCMFACFPECALFVIVLYCTITWIIFIHVFPAFHFVTVSYCYMYNFNNCIPAFPFCKFFLNYRFSKMAPIIACWLYAETHG